MISIYDVNLPSPTKLILSKFLDLGGKLSELENTYIYLIKLRGKDFLFKGDFNPTIPYMYGTIFSSKSYWVKILKKLGLPIGKNSGNRKKITFLITSNYLFNAIEQSTIKIKGDGKRNLKDLIEKENLKRINLSDNSIFPLKISANLNLIPRKGEEIYLKNNYEYKDVSDKVREEWIDMAERLISFFPGLPYLCFEIYSSTNFNNKNHSIGNVIISGGINLFFNISREKHKLNAAEFIVKDFLKF